MSSDVAIHVQGVSKCYQIYGSPQSRLKEFFAPKIRRILGLKEKKYYEEFWALKDVSFDVKSGETVGIIGQNGAGKSTLLQLIVGTLAASSGAIDRPKKIAAILELGAGFNPDFTGRENAEMNAGLLGVPSSEIGKKIPLIESYADIGEFFDQPVRIYSSGMYSRLAFAVAAHLDPDVLIVDEALSVGDAKFQAKCFRTFEQLQKSGKTILFVTHSVDLVCRHCTSAVLLNQGRVAFQGDPKTAVNIYLDLLFGSSRESASVALEKHTDQSYVGTKSDNDHLRVDGFESRPSYNHAEYRWGGGAAKVTDFILRPDGKAVNTSIVNSDELLVISLLVEFDKDVDRPIYGFTLKTPDGVAVAGTNSRDWRGNKEYIPVKSGEHVEIAFKFIPRVGGGDYLLSFGVAEDINGEIIPLDRRYDSVAITVIGNGRTSGLADLGIEFDQIR